ncbi:MAG TPA: 16S rRNA (uracil(1498)-N(3))-methyltransferase [Sulfurospirillum arcachonense]|nr:16S rRNA (uracil(1498)-N(3))-methyltransferase [Sulfurospirillum arcachonense]HIP43977.1 16S rRNA (uracil(1498)-N(3))-methyltransferase [Sulfurospirillum arcachonense]
MQFNFCESSGEQNLSLHVKEYSHIFKVRRIAVGAELDFSNLSDGKIYTYQIDDINKKEANLTLIKTEEAKKVSTCRVHVGWCVVDTKIVEKHIAMLSEMGVEKITFVYADFSQKNYKVDEKRLKRILINSCEQSGRATLIEIEVLNSVEEYLKTYPKSIIIDFSENYLEGSEKIESFLVGPEGGFSQEERDLFTCREIFGLKSPNILRSETVVVGVCAKLAM